MLKICIVGTVNVAVSNLRPFLFHLTASGLFTRCHLPFRFKRFLTRWINGCQPIKGAPCASWDFPAMRNRGGARVNKYPRLAGDRERLIYFLPSKWSAADMQQIILYLKEGKAANLRFIYSILLFYALIRGEKFDFRPKIQRIKPN